MKKILILFATLTMVIGLAACGNSKSNATTNSSSNENASDNQTIINDRIKNLKKVNSDSSNLSKKDFIEALTNNKKYEEDVKGLDNVQIKNLKISKAQAESSLKNIPDSYWQNTVNKYVKKSLDMQEYPHSIDNANQSTIKYALDSTSFTQKEKDNAKSFGEDYANKLKQKEIDKEKADSEENKSFD